MAKRQRIKVETMTYKLKDRQYNGLTTKNKGRNNDPQTPSQNIISVFYGPQTRTCI